MPPGFKNGKPLFKSTGRPVIGGGSGCGAGPQCTIGGVLRQLPSVLTITASNARNIVDTPAGNISCGPQVYGTFAPKLPSITLTYNAPFDVWNAALTASGELDANNFSPDSDEDDDGTIDCSGCGCFDMAGFSASTPRSVVLPGCVPSSFFLSYSVTGPLQQIPNPNSGQGSPPGCQWCWNGRDSFTANINFPILPPVVVSGDLITQTGTGGRAVFGITNGNSLANYSVDYDAFLEYTAPPV